MSYLNIFFTLNGQNINIQANSNDLFAEVAMKYMQKVGKVGEDLKFFFNSQELVPNSGKTLADYRITNQARIDVVLASTVIGALWKIWQLTNKFIIKIFDRYDNNIIKNSFNFNLFINK